MTALKQTGLTNFVVHLHALTGNGHNCYTLSACLTERVESASCCVTVSSKRWQNRIIITLTTWNRGSWQGKLWNTWGTILFDCEQWIHFNRHNSSTYIYIQIDISSSGSVICSVPISLFLLCTEFRRAPRWIWSHCFFASCWGYGQRIAPRLPRTRRWKSSSRIVVSNMSKNPWLRTLRTTYFLNIKGVNRGVNVKDKL